MRWTFHSGLLPFQRDVLIAAAWLSIDLCRRVSPPIINLLILPCWKIPLEFWLAEKNKEDLMELQPLDCHSYNSLPAWFWSLFLRGCLNLETRCRWLFLSKGFIIWLVNMVHCSCRVATLFSRSVPSVTCTKPRPLSHPGHSAATRFVSNTGTLYCFFPMGKVHAKMPMRLWMNRVHFESIAVVCFDTVPVQSIGPLPCSFVLIPEFALLSCYQDCADIIWMSPQSVRARWKESWRANVSGNIRHRLYFIASIK